MAGIALSFTSAPTPPKPDFVSRFDTAFTLIVFTTPRAGDAGSKTPGVNSGDCCLSSFLSASNLGLSSIEHILGNDGWMRVFNQVAWQLPGILMGGVVLPNMG